MQRYYLRAAPLLCLLLTTGWIVTSLWASPLSKNGQFTGKTDASVETLPSLQVEIISFEQKLQQLEQDLAQRQAYIRQLEQQIQGEETMLLRLQGDRQRLEKVHYSYSADSLQRILSERYPFH